MVRCPLCDTEVIADTYQTALNHFDNDCLKVPRLRPQSLPSRLARFTDRLIGFIANALPNKP